MEDYELSRHKHDSARMMREFNIWIIYVIFIKKNKGSRHLGMVKKIKYEKIFWRIKKAIIKLTSSW
jgi:hypothetical protein